MTGFHWSTHFLDVRHQEALQKLKRRIEVDNIRSDVNIYIRSVGGYVAAWQTSSIIVKAFSDLDCEWDTIFTANHHHTMRKIELL